MGSLNGKTAIVTGSGQGIGRDVALLFAREGASVIVNSRRPANDDGTPTAADVAKEIAAAGGRSEAVFADIGTMEGAAALVDAAVDGFGSVDILVNNAGVYPYVSVEEMTEDTWDMTMNVNLKAAYATAHFAVAHMRSRGGGRIINMISRAGLAGLPAMTAYSAAKAGVTGFTYGLAKELMEDRITVNCIAPSAATERSERDASTRRARTGHAKFAEVERTSEQVAPSVAFLASEAAAGITGRVFYVIGGEMTLYEPPTPSRSVIKQGLWEVDELTGVCATVFGTTLMPPVMSNP